jgi:hypothetical protein
MQPYEIHLRRDGSIDYNNYYARPVSLLTPAMRRFCKQVRSTKAIAVVIAAIAVVTIGVATAGHHSTCADCTSVNSSQRIHS